MGSKMYFCKKIPLPHYQESNGIFHFLKSVYNQIFLCNSYRQFCLFSDAIAKVLKSYDSDFFIEMSDTPDKTAELCRVIQPHILMMEITGQALWSLKERLAICREVRRYAPNCKFIFTVDEKANAETAKKVVECKKTGLIDCFIYNTISSSYMTAVLDSL